MAVGRLVRERHLGGLADEQLVEGVVGIEGERPVAVLADRPAGRLVNDRVDERSRVVVGVDVVGVEARRHFRVRRRRDHHVLGRRGVVDAGDRHGDGRDLARGAVLVGCLVGERDVTGLAVGEVLEVVAGIERERDAVLVVVRRALGGLVHDLERQVIAVGIGRRVVGRNGPAVLDGALALVDRLRAGVLTLRLDRSAGTEVAGVEADAAVEVVGATLAEQGVAAQAAKDVVGAGAAGQEVAAGAALDVVGADAAVDGVVAAVAPELVVAARTLDGVRALVPHDEVPAAATTEVVVAVATVDPVVAVAAEDHVVARAAEDVVGAAVAADDVVTLPADDRVEAALADDDVAAVRAEQVVGARSADDGRLLPVARLADVGGDERVRLGDRDHGAGAHRGHRGECGDADTTANTNPAHDETPRCERLAAPDSTTLR